MKKLKIKYSKLFPFKGFYACMLLGTVLIRKEYETKPINQTTINHETIHHVQATKDFGIGFAGYILFYLLYLLEWLFKLPSMLWGYDAYRSISFEQECYNNQHNFEYLSKRKRFAWAKYIFKLKK